MKTDNRVTMGPTENYKTDGPWIVGKTLPNGLALITNRCGLGVAEGMRGDAPLLAAAPELLAALKVLVKRHPAPCGFAITKKHDDAYTCGETSDGHGGTRICDECAPVFAARVAISKAEGI